MIVEKRQLDGGFTLLNVEGVIKLGESAQFFAQTLDRALSDDKGHVIIDFSGINFIDSTGIGGSAASSVSWCWSTLRTASASCCRWPAWTSSSSPTIPWTRRSPRIRPRAEGRPPSRQAVVTKP